MREDNAVFRLSHYGYKFKLLDSITSILDDKKDIEDGIKFLENKKYTPTIEFLAFLESIDEEEICDVTSGISLVARDSFDINKLRLLDHVFASMSIRALEQIKIESKYYFYIKKQNEDIAKLDSTLLIKIPDDFVFDKIPGLSLEIIEKLNKFRPKTLKDAFSISGITPASIDVLSLYIHLREKQIKNCN